MAGRARGRAGRGPLASGDAAQETDGAAASAPIGARPLRIERIDDAGDPRVADYRDLKDAERRRAEVFIAESRSVVRRLLVASPFHARSLFVTEAALRSLRDVVGALDETTAMYLARPEVMRQVAGFDVHRGCLAVAERGPEQQAEALVAPPGPRALLVVEEVANPDNVGGVFRNAAAFGVDAVLLSPGCADPLYRKTIRVSVGGSLTTPFACVRDWPGGLGRLRMAGYTLVALTPRAAALDLAAAGATWTRPDRIAILLGAEGAGLSPAARAAADLEVRIAMARGADSLNVATASGIALHRLRGPVLSPDQ